jgi:protease PrsW
MTLLLWVLAILPGLAISYWVYQQDKYEKEPHYMLFISFLWGCISTIPAFLGQVYFKETEDPDSFLTTFLFTFFVISLTEEVSKFLFLRFYAYPKDAFNEPMDGIVYAVMVGMGFATLENVLYVLGENGGISTAIGRAFTAVPAHAAFATMMGAYVGLAKFVPEKRNQYMLTGIVLAIFFHGLYDFFLIQKSFEGLAILSIIALSIAVTLARKLIRFNQEISPFKNKDDIVEHTSTEDSESNTSVKKDGEGFNYEPK